MAARLVVQSVAAQQVARVTRGRYFFNPESRVPAEIGNFAGGVSAEHITGFKPELASITLKHACDAKLLRVDIGQQSCFDLGLSAPGGNGPCIALMQQKSESKTEYELVRMERTHSGSRNPPNPSSKIYVCRCDTGVEILQTEWVTFDVVIAIWW